MLHGVSGYVPAAIYPQQLTRAGNGWGECGYCWPTSRDSPSAHSKRCGLNKSKHRLRKNFGSESIIALQRFWYSFRKLLLRKLDSQLCSWQAPLPLCAKPLKRGSMAGNREYARVSVHYLLNFGGAARHSCPDDWHLECSADGDCIQIAEQPRTLPAGSAGRPR